MIPGKLRSWHGGLRELARLRALSRHRCAECRIETGVGSLQYRLEGYCTIVYAFALTLARSDRLFERTAHEMDRYALHVGTRSPSGCRTLAAYSGSESDILGCLRIDWTLTAKTVKQASVAYSTNAAHCSAWRDTSWCARRLESCLKYA